MRYAVGETYLFIYVDFDEQNKDRFYNRLYLPWEHHNPVFNIIKLTCAEHHIVTDGYNEEAKENGFVFTDNEVKYGNQYPTYSTGQLDDSNSWHAYKLDSIEYIQDLRHYMNGILRGIRIYSGISTAFIPKVYADPSKVSQLEELFTLLCSKTREFGVEVKKEFLSYTDLETKELHTTDIEVTKIIRLETVQ